MNTQKLRPNASGEAPPYGLNQAAQGALQQPLNKQVSPYSYPFSAAPNVPGAGSSRGHALVHGLGNVPERSKEEEETPMRLTDRNKSDMNNRRRKKGDRLRPSILTVEQLKEQQPQNFLTPTNHNTQINYDIKKSLNDNPQKNEGNKKKNDDIFEQIQKGLASDNNPKNKKDDKLRLGSSKEPTTKKQDLLKNLNKKIADRKRQMSQAALNPKKNNDIIPLNMYKRSPIHQLNPFVRSNPSIIPGDPQMVAPSPDNIRQSQRSPSSNFDADPAAQNLYYPHNPSLGPSSPKNGLYNTQPARGSFQKPNQAYPFPDNLDHMNYPPSEKLQLPHPITTNHSPSNQNMHNLPHHRSANSIPNKSPIDAYGISKPPGFLGHRKKSAQNLPSTPSEEEIKQKIQEEVEKQYKLLFQQQTENKANKPQFRNGRVSASNSLKRLQNLPEKQLGRTQSQQERPKKLEPQDDKTYLKYKRNMFDDTKDMLLANQMKVEIKPDPKRKKKGPYDAEKEQMQREIEDLKYQMQAQKELFEVKQSLNELKEEMRKKHDEYKKSEVNEQFNKQDKLTSGSPKEPSSRPQSKINKQRDQQSSARKTGPKVKESPLVDPNGPILDLQTRKIELISSTPFSLHPIENRPKSSDRMRWHNQPPKEPKRIHNIQFKSPFQDFVAKGTVQASNKQSKPENTNLGQYSKNIGGVTGFQQSFSKIDAQTEWKDTCHILDRCDIIYNQSGQVLKQKQTFTRSDITNIAQGFSKKIVKLEQDNFNKDWLLEKEKQNCKQLINEKDEDYDKKIKFMQDQIEFEKKAMMQESIKLNEKIEYMTKKRAQDQDKLFDQMRIIKKQMDKQNAQLIRANHVLQKNFDLNVVALDFSNDLQLLVETYNQDLQKDNMKRLQPFDGHGMKPQPPKTVKQLLGEIEKLRSAYAGRGKSTRGRIASPEYGEPQKVDNRPRWSEEALENQIKKISDYMNYQLDSGRDSNVFKQHEKIKTDIIEPILKSGSKKQQKKLEVKSGKGSPRNSLTMSLTIDDQIYVGNNNTLTNQVKTVSKQLNRQGNQYNHQSLSNILQMQNTQSLIMSLSQSEKELDQNRAMTSISKPVTSFKISQDKRQSVKQIRENEYGGVEQGFNSQKIVNAFLDLPNNESRDLSKKFRNSRSLSYHKSNYRSSQSIISNNSGSHHNRGIYIKRIDEDTYRPSRFQNTAETKKQKQQQQDASKPQRGFIDLTPEKFAIRLDEKTDQHSAVLSLRSQLNLKDSQLEKALAENTGMQKKIHQLQNEIKTLQKDNTNKVRTDERVVSLERKYYATILSCEKQKQTIGDLQTKINRQSIHAQQQQNTMNQLEQKNKVVQNTLSNREWMQSLNESVKTVIENGRAANLSAQQREQLQAVFSHKLVQEMEIERKKSENNAKLIRWLLVEQVSPMYQLQENLCTSLKDAFQSKQTNALNPPSSFIPDLKKDRQLNSGVYNTVVDQTSLSSKFLDRKRSVDDKNNGIINEENQVYMDYINRQTRSLKHKMLMKFQEYQEFKDFQSEPESDDLYKLLITENTNNFNNYSASNAIRRPDRSNLPPTSLLVPQQITPRSSVSPGSGFEKPPLFQNYRNMGSQQMYSPRTNNQVRAQRSNQKRASSRSPSGRFDYRSLVSQKEQNSEDKILKSTVECQSVWLELINDEVKNVFYGDKEVAQHLNLKNQQQKQQKNQSSINADLPPKNQGSSNRVRFQDESTSGLIQPDQPKFANDPGIISFQEPDDDDGESSEEAAIAQEKSEQIQLKGISTDNKESLRKKRFGGM